VKRRNPQERGKYSKSKGKSFEDRMSIKMTELTGTKWLRIPASGGWKKMEGISGDLFLESNPGKTPYHVECKSGRGWSFRDLLKGKGLLWDWVSQALFDDKYNRPIVLFISFGGVIYIGLNRVSFEKGGWNCLEWFNWYFGTLPSFVKNVGRLDENEDERETS